MAVGNRDWCSYTNADTEAGNYNSTASYNLFVTGVEPNATPDNSFDAAPSGQYLYAAILKVTGVKGTYEDDMDSDVTVVGTNGQTYQATFGGTATYTNFNSGQVDVGPGQSTVGAVTFDIPNGVTIASVDYVNGLGSPASWKA